MRFYDFSLNFSHVGDKIPVASENASSSRPLTRSAKGNHAPFKNISKNRYMYLKIDKLINGFNIIFSCVRKDHR